MPDESPSTLPPPVMTGPEGERLRRFRDKIASGVIVPPVPDGERGVSFDLDAGDLRAFQQFSLKRNSKGLSLFIVGLGALAIILSVIQGMILPRPHRPPSPPMSWDHFLVSVFFSLLMPLLVFVAFWAIFIAVLRRRKDKSGILEPQTISLTAKSLTQQSAAGTGSLKWSFVKSVDKTAKYLFFTLHNNTGYVIPLWAFPSPDDANAFFDEAKDCWQKARSEKAGQRIV